MTANRPADKFANTNASVALDCLRGIAALLVLGEHWRNLIFADFPQLGSFSRTAKLLLLPVYVCTRLGHSAVVIFFVLSGYFITGSVLRLQQRGHWSWPLYLVHRLTRLWIVLLPGLLLCAVLDTIGLRSGHAPLAYAGLAGNHVTNNVSSVRSPIIFLGNLFFLQTVFMPVFGSDNPLWSLSLEFWFYLLFPLAFFAIGKYKNTRYRIVQAVIFVALACSVRGSVLETFPIWLLGSLVAFLPALNLTQRTRVLTALLFVSVLIPISRLEIFASDYILGLATAAFVWVLLSAVSPANPRGWFAVAARSTSRFSFTLYVTHMPLLLLLTALVVGDHRWLPSVLHVSIAVALLLLTMAYSWLVASLTEFKTDRVRIWAERRFGLLVEQKSQHEMVLEAVPPPQAP